MRERLRRYTIVPGWHGWTPAGPAPSQSRTKQFNRASPDTERKDTEGLLAIYQRQPFIREGTELQNLAERVTFPRESKTGGTPVSNGTTRVEHVILQINSGNGCLLCLKPLGHSSRNKVVQLSSTVFSIILAISSNL